MIPTLFAALFGGTRNVVSELIETVRPNAEAQAARAHDAQTAAMVQFAAEFAHARKGWFDRFVDGLNRLPRPLMALSTLGFFALLIYDPVLFASRMQPLDLVPDEMWWLIGAVVSFYFGARELAKSRQRSDRSDVTRVMDKMRQIEVLRATPPASEAEGAADHGPKAATGNAAIDA